MRWFGVKTIYRFTIQQLRGNASSKAEDSITDGFDLYEERIVLIRAESAERAIQVAEADAENYALQSRYDNLFHEAVSCKYIGTCDAFEIEGEPTNLAEVYSSTGEIATSTPDEGIADRLIPKPAAFDESRRKRFLRSGIASKLYGHEGS